MPTQRHSEAWTVDTQHRSSYKTGFIIGADACCLPEINPHPVRKPKRVIKKRNGHIVAKMKDGAMTLYPTSRGQFVKSDPYKLFGLTRHTPDNKGKDIPKVIDLEEEEFNFENELEVKPVDTLSDDPANQSQCQTIYTSACKRLGIVPVGRVVRQLVCSVVALHNVHLGEDGARTVAIALVLSPSVHHLDLHDNDIGAAGLHYILELVQENILIEKLSVTKNKLNSAGAASIGAFVASNNTIFSLDVSDNDFHDRDLIHIANGLKVNRDLQALNLSHNQFRECCPELIAALDQNVTLRNLDLSWNHIRLKGCHIVAQVLECNTGVHKLNLAWNGFGLEGCHELGKVIDVNRTLKELDMTSNRIDGAACKELFTGIRKNGALQRLKIGKNPLTTDSAFAILEALSKSKECGLEYLELQDIYVDNTFISKLHDIRKVRFLEVKYGTTLRHDDMKKPEIDVVLDTDDPLMMLFQYKKQNNLRLIDLFNIFDRNNNDKVSRNEFSEGFKTANMALSGRSLDILMAKMDANEDGIVGYEEFIQGQREYSKKLRKRSEMVNSPTFQYEQLRETIRMRIDARKGSQHDESRRRSMLSPVPGFRK